jgi:anti-sigma B factor antagonist
MNIVKNLDGQKLEVTLEGQLDTKSAPELTKEISDDLSQVTEVVMDFERVEYVSSAGMRALMLARKTLGDRGTITVTNANDMVKEVFALTGFDRLLILA